MSTQLAYIAGLFDGEGCVQYKQRMETKRKNRPRRYMCWMVTLEMSMTDQDAVRWFHEIVKVGTVRLHTKNTSPSSKTQSGISSSPSIRSLLLRIFTSVNAVNAS